MAFYVIFADNHHLFTFISKVHHTVVVSTLSFHSLEKKVYEGRNREGTKHEQEEIPAQKGRRFGGMKEKKILLKCQIQKITALWFNFWNVNETTILATKMSIVFNRGFDISNRAWNDHFNAVEVIFLFGMCNRNIICSAVERFLFASNPIFQIIWNCLWPHHWPLFTYTLSNIHYEFVPSNSIHFLLSLINLKKKPSMIFKSETLFRLKNTQNCWKWTP